MSSLDATLFECPDGSEAKATSTPVAVAGVIGGSYSGVSIQVKIHNFVTEFWKNNSKSLNKWPGSSKCVKSSRKWNVITQQKLHLKRNHNFRYDVLANKSNHIWKLFYSCCEQFNVTEVHYLADFVKVKSSLKIIDKFLNFTRWKQLSWNINLFH